MNNDRQIIISAAGSRKAVKWPQQNIYWSELVERLKTPVRSTETLHEYLKLSKSKQDDLKDVGGFVAGSLKENKRGSNTVIGRSIVTLDLDNIPSGETQNTLIRIDGLGCSYAVYSTRKHEPVKPRLRVLLPLNRTCTADEYEPIARKIASIIGIELCDPTTFQASRLMYWPSCCSDSQYVYQHGDKPFLDADGILNLYSDWRNIVEWPQVPGAPQAQVKYASKQSDPTEKSGVVGAFCKIYDIYKAIDTFIPEAYTTCDIGDRLTYTGGSTTAGAIVYDNGKFLFSHHATDPAGGKLCNAFDLIRLHKFGELDEDAKPDTPTNKLSSYSEMCKLAVTDSLVAALQNKEREEQIKSDFSEIIDDDTPSGELKLKRNSNNAILKTSENLLAILENDPVLKNKIIYEEFTEQELIAGALPWNGTDERRTVSNVDYQFMKIHIEKYYGVSWSTTTIAESVDACAFKNSVNAIKQFLLDCKWDGIKRVDTLLIDYLGAEDNDYTRAVMRKSLCAAVSRVMSPGCKYDTMPIFVGPQGIGKSTFLRFLGRNWFSDSLQTFKGKEAAEQLPGVWIFEIGELNAMNKAEITEVKQFLSKVFDIYRAAYARKTAKRLRKCIFFGTTNDDEFLKDPTGNRRFWPVDVGVNEPTKSIFNELEDEVPQIWAEVMLYWRAGEPLYLSGDVAQLALEAQKAHEENNPKEGLIREFIEKEIPFDWDKKSIWDRRSYWAGDFILQGCKTTRRDKICAAEIWCECFNGDLKLMKQADSRQINNILLKVKGTEKYRGQFGPYGSQRGFKLSHDTI